MNDTMKLLMTLIIITVILVILTRDIEFSVGFFVFGLLAAIISQRLGHYFLDYRIADSGIWIFCLRIIPVMLINFGDIVEIRRASVIDALRHPFGRAMGNALFALGRIVMIRKSRGLYGVVFITPRDPRKFVEDVNQRRRKIDPSDLRAPDEV
jgi:hypothetical protein